MRRTGQKALRWQGCVDQRDARLIASAKAYAQQHGKSVSQLVADYFAALERTKSVGDLEENAPASYAPITQCCRAWTDSRLPGAIRPDNN